MKRSIVYTYSIILNIFFGTAVFAQQGVIVDRDYRIAKFEKDIIQYLFELDAKAPLKVEDYKYRIVVLKRLEIYSDNTNTHLLLIKFRIADDHSHDFWGILSDKEKYFFFDPDDTGEPELSMFKKRYDPATVATIIFYCDQYLPEDTGVGLITVGIYYKNLTIIKECLHTKEGLDIAEVNSAILFLEKITGIKPGSNGDHSGGYHLTQQDYTNWLNWVKKNYTRLHWDDKEQKMTVGPPR